MQDQKLKRRSQAWFDNPGNPGMTALYLERYLNYGITRGELQSGKPIIGIAQTGSDLAPCNRHHTGPGPRGPAGTGEAGGLPFDSPAPPTQEREKRPPAALDRTLPFLGLVELLYGYPIAGVVRPPGGEKPTPACIM